MTLLPRARRAAWHALLATAALLAAVALALGSSHGGSRIEPAQAGAATATAASLPAFDVASVRPFPDPDRPWHRDARFDPQRLYIEGMAPNELIKLAYSLNWNQLAGLPDWAQFSRDHLYTITATTEKPTSKDQMLLMLRRLLADRFGLVLRESDEIQPVYDLVVAPGGPKLTPLKPDEDCGSAIDGIPRPKDAPSHLERFDVCTIPDLVAHLNGSGAQADLPVIDKTHISGEYLIAVFQSAEITPTEVNGVKGESFAFNETIAEAMKRQLGLMLVKDTAPYRVLRVASIARPAPDE